MRKISVFVYKQINALNCVASMTTQTLVVLTTHLVPVGVTADVQVVPDVQVLEFQQPNRRDDAAQVQQHAWTYPVVTS